MPGQPSAGSGHDAEWVVVGFVRGAFGVHGAVRVEPVSSVDDTVLLDVASWRIVPQAGPALAVTVDEVHVHGALLVAVVRPQPPAVPLTREHVEALRGAGVQVRRADFPEPADGEHYWSDLIGCQVVTAAGDVLGTVAAIDDHGAQQVLRLDDGLLIPYVAAHVLDVDTTAKRIVADWSSDWR